MSLKQGFLYSCVSNRREIKNRIAFKIWTAVPRVEKNKIGAAVQILDTIRFIIFYADSFTRGQSNMRRFIYERSATYIRDWSLAYSFIYPTHQSISFHWKLTDQRLFKPFIHFSNGWFIIQGRRKEMETEEMRRIKKYIWSLFVKIHWQSFSSSLLLLQNLNHFQNNVLNVCSLLNPNWLYSTNFMFLISTDFFLFLP